MAVLFFLLLALGLIAITAVAVGAVFLLTLTPTLRPYRMRLLRATVGGSAGCFLGGLIAFITVLVIGLTCRVANHGALESNCVGVADAPPWMLLGGLPVGLVLGSVAGWRWIRSTTGSPQRDAL